MPNHRAAFINVDLDLDSTTDLRGLVVALGSAVMPMHSSRTGRRHSVRLQLSPQLKNPAQAITRFAKAVAGTTRKHRQLWNRIRVKEFDIGIQAGDKPDAMEWVVDAAAVKAAASLGARIRITVYSPRLLTSDSRAERCLPARASSEAMTRILSSNRLGLRRRLAVLGASIAGAINVAKEI